METFKLTVNGKDYKISADKEMPLLWALRDFVGLTGAKYGCGVAQCGCCTVHLNGTPVRSCSVSTGAAANQQITTIEGLGENGTHPLQQAWIDEDVPQCGYCQAGQIMTAAALLNKNPNPNDEEITNAMNGNLCRCGTYSRIHKAIKRASQMKQ